MGFRFRRLIAGTTVLTYGLMLLGVYTAAYGAGLTCGANWPLCDGAVFGLFPANVPSFIEWFHRLVAMVTGFVIIGTAIAAWRGNASRRVAGAVTAAVLLLPFQILLGGGTVRIYAPVILLGHFTVALSILSLLTYATVRTWGTPDEPWLRRVAVAAPVLGCVAVVFSYGGPLVYTQAVQTFHYALSIGLFAVVLTAALWTRTARRTARVRAHRLFVAGTGLTALLLVLGRRVFGVVPPTATVALSVVVLGVLVAATWFVLTTDGTRAVADPLTGDAD